MKAVLALHLVLAAALNTEALKCHSCVAINMDECNKQQGSTMCASQADACSTFTTPYLVTKSCTYMSFCVKANLPNDDVTLECCTTDDCNGPQPPSRSPNYGRYHYGIPASAPSISTISTISTLLVGIATIRLAFSIL